MTNNQVNDLYEYILSNLREADLLDIHEIAYQISSDEIRNDQELFLDMYVGQIVRQLRMYDRSNIENIVQRINLSISNPEPITNIKMELSENEKVLSEVNSIDLNEAIDFGELITTLNAVQIEIRKDRNRGLDISF